MQQAVITLDLELIFSILAAFTIIVSLWGIVYFASRIALSVYIKYQVGDMPTAEEISEHYRRINETILYIQSETDNSLK